jgi:hypothetical protein
VAAEQHVGELRAGSRPVATTLHAAPKQYLAFIYAYMLVLGRPPADADLPRHFRVPPSVH